MLDEACRQLDALLSDAELDRFADLDYHLANRSGLRHVHLDKPHVLDMPCCIRPVPIKSLFQAHILREIASLRKEANYVTLTDGQRPWAEPQREFVVATKSGDEVGCAEYSASSEQPEGF